MLIDLSQLGNDPQRCPYCISLNVDAHYETGCWGNPGPTKVGPYHCFDCDAVEMGDHLDYPDATPEERQKGWLRGDI